MTDREVLKQLAEAVRKVIEGEGQIIITDEYPSRKNNKCKHGNYGYEGCENCIVEGLTVPYETAKKWLEGTS